METIPQIYGGEQKDIEIEQFGEQSNVSKYKSTDKEDVKREAVITIEKVYAHL